MMRNQNDDVMEQAAYDYVQRNDALREAVGARTGSSVVLSPLGMGEHNVNYLLAVDGHRFVLRINVATQPFHANQVAYEFTALEELASSGRTPAPIFLDDSENALGKGVLVESFCEGDLLDFDHLRPGDVRCAAQIMADVHAVPIAAEMRLFMPKDPLRELFDECRQRFEVYRTSAYEDVRITKWAQRFIAAAEKALGVQAATAGDTHIVNTETLPSHFLIPTASAAEAAANVESGGAFCSNPGYFVDWERPIIGEVAQDVAYFVSPTTTFWDSEFLFPANEIDEFVEDYWRAVDGRFERDGFDERFQAWLMMTALRSTTWCCRALVTYNDPSVHKTEKTARKLPMYLSDDFMEMLADEVFHL